MRIAIRLAQEVGARLGQREVLFRPLPPFAGRGRMKIDFWQFSQGSVERIVALIAGRVRDGGDRLLIVDGDDDRRTAISQALWGSKPTAFMANGESDAPHAARQPILLSANCDPVNGAKVAVFADGVWRDEGEGFDLAAARALCDDPEWVEREDGRGVCLLPLPGPSAGG
mgnify:CR=1 FL=1